MIDDARSQRFAHHTELESYRSGHNEAVLKTVCPRGHVGSNPTLSALKKETCIGVWLIQVFLRQDTRSGSFGVEKVTALCDNRSEIIR